MSADLDDILVKIHALDKGIIPYGLPLYGVSNELSSLSADESRKVRRKFRKLFRKAIKELYFIHGPDSPAVLNVKSACGYGLSRDQLKLRHMTFRAKVVLDMLYVETA
jgi:hypothetical protein